MNYISIVCNSLVKFQKMSKTPLGYKIEGHITIGCVNKYYNKIVSCTCTLNVNVTCQDT